MNVARKLDIGFVASVCPPLSAMLVQQRTIAGQDLDAPVSLGEVERLPLPKTTGADVLKWRERILNNLGKAANTSQTGSEAGLNRSEANVRAAMQGMTAGVQTPEVVLPPTASPRFDYTKPPTIEWQTEVQGLKELVAGGEGLLATTFAKDTYLLDVGAKVRVDQNLNGMTLGALRNGTLLTLPSPRELSLVVNGEVFGTCHMTADVAWVKPLQTGGFMVRLKDDTIQCFDERGNQRGEWRTPEDTKMKVLSGDLVAITANERRRIDVVDATTGDVVRSFSAGSGSRVMLDCWVALSDDRMLITTVNGLKRRTETRLFEVDGSDSQVEYMEYSSACSLPGPLVATISGHSFSVCGPDGAVINKFDLEDDSNDRHASLSMVALGDGRIALGDRVTNKVTVYRFPKATE